MNFVKLSLKYPQVTVTVLLLTFIVGIHSLLTMPRREDAMIDVRQGQIIAVYPGASSEQVEEQVTKKIERYLFQFGEVRREKTISTSRDGLAIITVALNSDITQSDVFWSKLRHQLLVVKAVDLPQGVQGVIVNSDYSETEAMLIGLTMERPDYVRLRDCAVKLADDLRTIKAVSKVKFIGEQKEEIVVALDSARLERYGLNFGKVRQILQSQNAIGPAGDVKTPDAKVSLYAGGYYRSESEIADQIIGAAPTGEVVRLGAVAKIQRQYREPDSRVMVNGRPCVLLGVQMHEGYNVVEYGKAIERRVKELSGVLPSDVKLVTVVNQPAIIDRNVSSFIHEFLLAIVSVIVVIVLMLPFRVAAVAATAIPMTVAATFCLLHLFGVELHQVSLSTLIVVLGMVVDDAVVIADNYVDLLDKGVDRATAAWRSASDLVVPVLTATITIIAAFAPILMLTGMIGEFIHALPITVTVALSASFFVAMFLTPLLCLAFIKKGLHDPAARKEIPGKKKRRSFLDIVQSGYDRRIGWCMAHPRATIFGCLATIVAAVLMFQLVPQKFFPAAERNQFLIELRMPTGTKLEKTESALKKLEDLIQSDSRVTSYASFLGSSPPRFYYNFTPEFPESNFAQILVNTRTNGDAVQMHRELGTRADAAVPEGRAQIKMTQQGMPSATPIEIRIVGDDLDALKRIGAQVQELIRKHNVSQFVRTDFREDYYSLDIRMKADAERLGFTTSSIAQTVYAGFTGAPVSTMYEADHFVDIILRLEDRKRENFQDLENMYLTSPVTGSSVPLRQIAALEPSWHSGRIIHRNGVRTLTVQCEPLEGVLPSKVLKMIRPELDKVALPPGYRIEIGGEYEGQRETFSEMLVALGVSLLVIFFVLLFQFRSIKQTLMVMLTIPLSAFGAFLGLIITHNPFGFTAFVGLISLSGIVVRNAIILIDYANELVRNGADIPTAALEAGKRRLRPILLTASAAAFGVVPMIISASPLWSPLASVIAVGVMWSMVTSLLLVPVLYARIIKPAGRTDLLANSRDAASTGRTKTQAIATVVLIAAVLLGSTGAQAQAPPEKLTLDQVTNLALSNNHLLGIKHLQVEQKKQKVKEDQVKYFPMVGVLSSVGKVDFSDLTIPQGSIRNIPLGSTTVPIPLRDETIELKDRNTNITALYVYQPIFQLGKIREGVGVSKTEVRISEAEEVKARTQIKQGIEKLYFGILILQKQKEESALKLELSRTKLHDVESAVLAGKTSSVNKTGLQAAMADEEQNLLKLDIQLQDLTSDLKHLAGLPASGEMLLEPVATEGDHIAGTSDDSALEIEALKREAQANNTDLKLALLSGVKADQAIKASRYSYLPDLGIVGVRTFQEGSATYPLNEKYIGVSLNWNIQDAFSNTYVKRQRIYLKKQADENIANTKEQVEADLEKALRKVGQWADMTAVAEKAVAYRRQDMKLQTDRRDAGLSLQSEYLAARAALAKSEADLYAAQLSYRLALTDLKILAGRF